MLDYKDIVIKPINSRVVSPELVDISFHLPDEKKILSLPLLTRLGGNINKCTTFSELGIVGIIDKLDDIYGDSENISLLSRTNLWGMSVYLDDNPMATSQIMKLNPTIIEIRSNNGYSLETLKLTSLVKEYCVAKGLNSLILSGNVLTLEGAVALQSAGADMVRVGNLNSAVFDIPKVTAIEDCWNADALIVTEENELNFGDFIKALVVGADFYMVNRIVPDNFGDYRPHIQTIVNAYSNDLRKFCMAMNATTIDAMRNNSEVLTR